MGAHHDRRYPNEPEDYRAARDALLAAEIELRQRIEDVAAQRRQLPLGGAVDEDYVFQEVDAQAGTASPITLSELFGKHGSTLIVYQFMYGPDWEAPCPSCTSITDSTNGIASHVRAKTNMVTVAKAQPEKLIEVAQARGWYNIRLLSSFGTEFNSRYFAEDSGGHYPLVNVFVRRDDRIHHWWSSELFFVPMQGAQPRHVDLIWPLWNFLDMTPEGRGDFAPALSY